MIADDISTGKLTLSYLTRIDLYFYVVTAGDLRMILESWIVVTCIYLP